MVSEPTHLWSRRQAVLGVVAAPWFASCVRGATAPFTAGQRSRMLGMLVGGLAGDALGGPVEFGGGELVDAVLPGTRHWPVEKTIDENARGHLAASLKLHSYEQLRPDVAAYGPWLEKAPAGTITDDSRHKIILMRTLRKAIEADALPVSATELAHTFLGFQTKAGPPDAGKRKALVDEGLREYRYAARWLLGERNLDRARPLERLWAGTDNCSGQMLLPPLAAVYPGQPDAAYRAAFALDFIDAPGARDIAASLVAGLAAVMDARLDGASLETRWSKLLTTMREVDPYGYAEVPFAGRPLHKWLDRARQFAQRANGRPAKLFEILEQEGQPIYWWDAHFTLLVPLAVLEFCSYDPLAAMHLTLDFRHDSDSYAQVLGCLAGAVCGVDAFPADIRETVSRRLVVDYGEDPEEWLALLLTAAGLHQAGNEIVRTAAS